MKIERASSIFFYCILATLTIIDFAPAFASKKKSDFALTHQSDCGPLPNFPCFSEPISADLKTWFISANASIKQSIAKNCLSLPHDAHLALIFQLDSDGKILEPIVLAKANSEQMQRESLIFLNKLDSLPKPPKELINRRFMITFMKSYELMMDLSNDDERYFQNLKKKAVLQP
jgi:hypothetical protein